MRAPVLLLASALVLAVVPDGGSRTSLALRTVSGASQGALEDAVARIRRSIDPCGESAEVLAVLDDLTACAAGYRLETSTTVKRNVFDRGETAECAPTITWNPELRSELERGCDGDTRKPVLRDPTASLLHELVHARQACRGLDPGQYELDAVRIENIYRRAAGLCQRRHYGDEPLPPEMIRDCAG